MTLESDLERYRSHPSVGIERIEIGVRDTRKIKRPERRQSAGATRVNQERGRPYTEGVAFAIGQLELKADRRRDEAPTQAAQRAWNVPIPAPALGAGRAGSGRCVRADRIVHQ